MLVLGIDTCCMPASAAIFDGEKLLGEVTINNGNTHSQKIMPMVGELMSSLEIRPRDIDCFAAAVGPGSYTGVRIGAASVKAMAHGTGKPCVGVSTLKALANNILFFDGIICPILDARRDRVYAAEFTGDGSLSRLCEDRAVPVAQLLAEIEETGKRALFLGDGALTYREVIKERLRDKAAFAKCNNCLNLAGSVAVLGYEEYMAGNTVGYSELVPNYIGLSQAERERRERLKAENQSK